MVILGLGSNIGNKVAHLRSALNAIYQIPNLSVLQVSPLYISDAVLPDNAPPSWNQPYFNLAIRCETQLTPHALLSFTKKIEMQLGRMKEGHWGPRNIDIDILAWDDLILYDEVLHIPHENLPERPFALWPLVDVAPFWMHPHLQKTAVELAQAWGSRFTAEAPFRTKQISHRIDTPQLVGILNITPNSFSDGAKFTSIEASLQQAHFLVESGAEIIDIGAEATGPHVKAVDEHTEWLRLEPVLQSLLKSRELNQFFLPPQISVDTRHASVAEKALIMGVDWINDVSGLTHPDMEAVLVAQGSCDVVMMHHISIPADSQKVLAADKNPVKEILLWAEKKLQQTKIDLSRIIFDAGIGFGKNAEQSLALIKSYHVFKSLGVRLLAGHSRKSFINLFHHHAPVDRDLETAIISSQLGQQKIDYLRVHNIDFTARTFKVNAAIHHLVVEA